LNIQNNLIYLSSSFEEMVDGVEPVRNTTADDNEDIYLDCIFLCILNIYSRMVNYINSVQWFTKTATYKILSGFICVILYFYCAGRIYTSSDRVNRSFEKFKTRQDTLKTILSDEAHNKFFNDTRLFFSANE